MQNQEGNLGYLINKAAHLIKWELNSYLKEYQLTSSQWGVLMDIKCQENRSPSLNKTTPALIAERLSVERPAITRVIESLIKEGWVKKQQNDSDGRSHLIILTDKSRQILPELMEIRNKVVRKTFKGFKKDEVEQLREYLIKVINNFNEG
ncbi:MarR family winged helix-turn-helix transcriptional regulator [Natronincola ferrireducens]|uniref:DNA-binding transcriptional regulator, MarR family n=1 Tax=Natronincola ferrireducens TaxID=393762 RepID=A0A1G9DUK4_9FIRM|nr:MarR family transcriptional regulator [Natronincola ferrireducens]SDK67545.1 DNA-binding transcriptional regulator, MarR family [Natronincola ferrireducens]